MKLAAVLAVHPFAILGEEPEFRKLWGADLVSRCGSGITGLALPLTAVVVLRASVVDMGVLVTAGMLPNLLLGLPAGVVVDRLPRRAIMVTADLGRATLLASIPAAALLGLLRIEQLCAVAFLETALELLFDVAAIGFVPSLLGRSRLLEGNTVLGMNGQVAKIAGPSLAGALVQVLSAPLAITLDALSFVASALFLRAVRVAEPPPGGRDPRTGWWGEILEGLRLVVSDPVLRSILVASVLGALAGAVQAPLLILFFTRELGLAPTTLGVVLAMNGVGAIVGSMLARPVARAVGVGRATASGTLLAAVGMGLVPLAGGPSPALLGILVAAQALFGLGVPIYGINQLTIRQTVVAAHLPGRANASRRFFTFAAAPLGAMVSGYLSQAVGQRPTLLLGAVLMGLAFLWTIRSPLWSLRDVEATRRDAV